MSLKKFIVAVSVVVIGYFWLNYIKRGPIYESNKSLHGKTVLITGGNAGIGKATAIELAKRGARVVIASRNREKSNAAVREIIKESKNEQIRAMHLDLSDFDSVRSFAKEFDETEQNLDYLINNAGLLNAAGKTKLGVNKIFVINHFGPFLLTNLLLPKMKAQCKSRPVRILNLSSGTYRWGYVTSEKMHRDVSSTLDMYSVYASSKLANIYFTAELNRRLRDFDITTYVIHPGFIDSEIADNFFNHFQFLVRLQAFLFKRSVFYGCQTTLYCTLDDEVIKYSGKYFENCKQTALWSQATNETAERELWEKSMSLTGLEITS